MPKRDSTVRGREFGAGVREALRKAGLTGRAAAELAGWDPAKLSDMLNGKGGVTEGDLHRLLGLCRTPLDETEHLVALFHETSQSGWLQVHGEKMPVELRTLHEHEATATEITYWCMNVVPAVLQLPDYMRALFLGAPNVPNKEIDKRVAARTARQQQLFQRRCPMTFYIHEYALRLPAGDGELMSDQLHHLNHMSNRTYIMNRVVPVSAGVHAGLAGVFTFMKFAKLEPIVYVDAENHGVFLDDKESAKAYLNILASLDRTALDVEQSRELITSIAS
ncbi:helix-turn-helix protein [Lentzea atacamensis]|uniref:Helix-turn-helix protein n=1 Tax=Lentzea atacamensis TaxID=531938 RepID=A0A316HMW8_9PSEU|nr:helix-turn-helix transcriptional regulator [Lentzea atacamensis]PWK82079.1 helix-turn-helix protein [Lentzea atacamensis]